MATYYNPSDYGDKYYKGFTDERGIEVGLCIKQRGYSGREYRIGRIQGLNFQIQGNEEITDPIVKTNLQITLLDDIYYPDSDGHGLYYDGSQWYRVGDWREFYTPDSTKYLVELSYDTVTIWRGYITPDSYSESLDAYGSVTITVRDNIGHLQDFNFDMGGDSNGLVKVTDLITQAFTKIAFPMDLAVKGFSANDDKYLISEDGNYHLEDLYFNAAALEGETYYDALEGVLNSLGLCLRFTDEANFCLAPLRAMPYCGYNESEASAKQYSQELQFYGRRSGTRTFDPAYRQITENVNFEQEDDFSPDIMFIKKGTISESISTRFTPYFYNPNATDPDGDKYTNHYIPTGGTISKIVHSVSDVSSPNGWDMFPTKNLLIDTGYSLREQAINLEGEGARDYLFLAANISMVNAAIPSYDDVLWLAGDHGFGRRVKNTQLTVSLNFAAHPMGFGELYGSSADFNKLGVLTTYNLAYIQLYIMYATNEGIRYWDGNAWRSNTVDCIKEYDATIEATSEVRLDLLNCDEMGNNGTLKITIVRIRYQCIGYQFNSSKPYILSWAKPYGVYARLKSITFSATSAKKVKSDTVTTICNTSNNVRCERNPKFGFLPVTVDFVSPINYKNAFYVYAGSFNIQFAPYRWRWNTDQSVLPFPVRIHQQLLMYHYTTEEVLEGDCGLIKDTSGYGSIAFDWKNVYHGKNYLLKSCTFDLIKGRFTTAELRSFKYYTDLWNGDETYNDDKIS